MGHLEMTLMEILWDLGEGNVRDVAGGLPRPLAYNTVMTTLDRLYKKGLLSRRMRERAYFYSPLLSRLAWRQKKAESLVVSFLSEAGTGGGMLVSCFLDAVERHDKGLLDELEERIRVRRKELDEGRTV